MRVGVGGFSRNIITPSQTDEEYINTRTKKQTQKNKDFLDNDNIIKALRLETSEIPKNVFPENTTTDIPRVGGNKHLPWETNINLPLDKLQMPGPENVINSARGVTGALPGIAQDIHSRMRRAVTEGPYNRNDRYDPTGEYDPYGKYDPRIGMLGPEILTGGFGRATGLGAQGARFTKHTMSGKS